MSHLIQAKKLCRWYGIVLGLNNISFELSPGLTGLVGPNGAGKSTLIQLITGQLRPSSGELTVLGQRPWNNPALLHRIGFCPEKEAVHGELRPLDWLQAKGRLSGLSSREISARSGEILKRVGLAEEHWNKKLGQFSKGMRQRVKLAQALLHDPDLLVLDEPMNGLDPMGRQEVAEILKTLATQGKSILISSHILPELESLCKNILILNWGRIIASGSQDAIRRDHKNWAEQLLVRCDQPELLARQLFDARLITGFHLDEEKQTLSLRIRDPESFYPQWTSLILASGVTVQEIRSESRSLKQIFEKVTT